MPKSDSFLPARGAAAQPLRLEVIRPLIAEDLARAHEAPKSGPPPLQKLRAIHHRQAQLLAGGKTVSEVAAIVGTTPQRIVQLKNDPSFAELVAYYQDQIMAASLEDSARLRDKLVDLGEMAVDELRERMEEEGRRKGIATGDIRKIAELALDRTVAPPKTATPIASPPAAITINFGTSLAVEEPAQPAAEPKTIEHEPAPEPQAPSKDVDKA